MSDAVRDHRAASALFALPAPLFLACGSDDGGDTPGPECDERDILDQLEEVPGLSAVEESSDPSHRVFAIEYEQPADHDRPDGVTFVQRMTLLHVDCAAPMVLHTTGYNAWSGFGLFRAEPTVLLEANQLDVEQRYFAPSRPEPADWSLLTIEQAAADHHRIVQAMDPLYPGAWVSTGQSKGGMTSIFHRRFHPGDVDATVAYVAPISFGAPDDRYHAFFDTVGDESCRSRVSDLQREILVRREPMLERMAAEADDQGFTFERLGGIEAAFEDAVIELAWSFWQYGGAGLCDAVPETGDGDDALYDFFSSAGAVTMVSDPFVEAYSPYYYQAETQLGYPSAPRDHIEDLLVTQKIARNYLPDGATATYDGGAAMQDIQAWVDSEGERLLFIYGEWDPWYAGAFQLGGAADSFLYVAPQRDHGALIADLEPDDRDAALDALARWTGVEPDRSRRRSITVPRSALPPPR